jgi:hypothetical protein
VDGQDQLWVVEGSYYPKPITLWGVDGTFKKEFLGNTGYGGGGCLDPYDKSRLFYGPLEFQLDWKAGTTRLKNLTWWGDSPAGETPIRIQDRTYLVTRPTFLGQSVGVVYLYESDHLRRVAAIGSAGRFPPLRTSEILGTLGKRAIGYFEFLWSDRNGDGNPQTDEVQFFETKDARGGGIGRFDSTLSVDAGDYRYDATQFLPNGVPVYERRKKTFGDGAERMFSGQFFVVGNNQHMAGITAEGKTMWTHPTEGWGVHALYYAKPYFPGQTVAQFGVIGHETAAAGDIGEFFVTHSNTGAWHIWTGDGLLAGRILRDMRGGSARSWSMREHQRGMDLTGLTAGQEHFTGYFCRTREDDRYYIVAGHNHVSVVEVLGIEQFRRLGGDITVSPQDIQVAMEWDRKKQARRLYESAKLIECHRAAKEIKVDGDSSDWETESAQLTERDVTLSMVYDDANLYLGYHVRESGPMRNAGNDWKRLFKTGAAVDLQIGTDPAAPPGRRDPVQGDIRLLMTYLAGKPTAVLYQPVCPGARPEENWETRTMVFQARFDRVVLLPETSLAARESERGYFLEAAIPLKAIGLNVEPNLTLKMDWGVLASGPDGNEVQQRLYWANPQTSIVSDEAAEAMLHPDLWGTIRFSSETGPKGQPEIDMKKTLEPGADSGSTEDIELEEN